MDVFDSCTFCSSRASSLPEGGLVHSWPGVYQAEAFSVVVFCLVGFCAPILSTPFPLPSYLRPFSTLCSMLVIVFIPNVYNIETRSNSMGSSSWGPKDSVKRKERRGCVAQRGRPPPAAVPQPPPAEGNSRQHGHMCIVHEENTTKSILEEVEERKMSFYLIFIRRKED